MEKIPKERVPRISEFFKGKSVFLTGGSGFLGRVLIEKLLRSCPEIKNIYLLLRKKRGKSLEERMNKIINVPLFDLVREQNQDALSKLIPIAGDTSLKGLGISDEDRKLLKKEVNIIYHSAASVRFNDPLKYAIRTNLSSTVEIIHLAQELENLIMLAHVSTAYSNLVHLVIEEKIYDNNLSWQDALRIADEMDEDALEVFTQKYIGKYDNTYIFTKQLAERAVHELCKGKLPTVLLRPSIINPAMKEPIEGWVDNYNGPFAISTAGGTGICNIMFGEKDVEGDYVFVDNVAKACIIAVWEKAVLSKNNDEIPVYNCCTDTTISGRMFCDIGHETLKTYPFETKLWARSYSTFTNSFIYYFTTIIIMHLIPHLVLDGLMILLKKKPMFTSLLRKVYIANLSLSHFLMTYFTFKIDNYRGLPSKLLDEDKPQFTYVLIDRNEVFKRGIVGIKKFLLNEPDASNKRAIKIDYWWRMLDRIIRYIIYGITFYIILLRNQLLTIYARKFYSYFESIEV